MLKAVMDLEKEKNNLTAFHYISMKLPYDRANQGETAK